LRQQVYEFSRFGYLHNQYGVGPQGGGEGVAAGVTQQGSAHNDDIGVHQASRSQRGIALRGDGNNFLTGVAQALLPEADLLVGVGSEQDAKKKRRHCSRKNGFSFKEKEAKRPMLLTATNSNEYQFNCLRFSLCGLVLGLLILGVAVAV
jgi:hypothetical protein